MKTSKDLTAKEKYSRVRDIVRVWLTNDKRLDALENRLDLQKAYRPYVAGRKPTAKELKDIERHEFSCTLMEKHIESLIEANKDYFSEFSRLTGKDFDCFSGITQCTDLKEKSELIKKAVGLEL